jgi:predicted molibdopterin-dependent oxidoreductase YjgC
MLRRVETLVQRASPVFIDVDGRRVAAEPGESLAVALAISGITTLRMSPERGEPRGMFCLMGVCQECAVRVDGCRTTACTEPVRAGMVVETGGGWSD